MEKVVSSLKAWIAKGKCPPGAFLPSERAIAEKLGVARNTVRNALNLLQKEGCVSLEGRRGAVVRDLCGTGVQGVVLRSIRAAPARGRVDLRG